MQGVSGSLQERVKVTPLVNGISGKQEHWRLDKNGLGYDRRDHLLKVGIWYLFQSQCTEALLPMSEIRIQSSPFIGACILQHSGCRRSQIIIFLEHNPIRPQNH